MLPEAQLELYLALLDAPWVIRFEMKNKNGIT